MAGGQTEPAQQERADFWRRVAAHLVDTTLLFVLAFLVPYGLFALGVDLAFVAILPLMALWMVGIVVWMVRTNGQTPGKQLAGIRVVRPEGKRMASAGASCARPWSRSR